MIWSELVIKILARYIFVSINITKKMYGKYDFAKVLYIFLKSFEALKKCPVSFIRNPTIRFDISPYRSPAVINVPIVVKVVIVLSTLISPLDFIKKNIKTIPLQPQRNRV